MILEIKLEGLDKCPKDGKPSNKIYKFNKKRTNVFETLLSEIYASTQYSSVFIYKSQ